MPGYYFLPSLRRVLVGCGLAAGSFWIFAADSKVPAKPAELLDASKIWSIHLTFTQQQWDAMEPKGGGGFGGRGGPGGRGGMRMGGPGELPAMIATPAFMKGDKDADGKLSREEFVGLGNSWFKAWDKQNEGKLSNAQLTAGVRADFATGGFPGMPGMPGPGGPGGPGGGGPGRGMQGQDGKRNGASAMSGIDFEYVHAAIDFNGATFKDVAVRYKGNSTFMMSRDSLKRSMKVELNKYVKGQKIGGVTKLNLHSNVTDAAWMNEPLSYRLFRDGKVPAPRTSYARVYLTIPGKYDNQYVGLYSVVEDVDSNFAEERFGTREGAIFKPSTQSLFTYLGDDWAKYKQIYDAKTELTAAQKQRVLDFAKLVTSGSDADFTERLATFIDVDEFARYMAINVWLANMDSILAMGQNFYLYLDSATNKFQIMPWDLDLSFGGMGGGSDLSVEHPWRGQNRFLERLFAADSFKKAYLARMAEFNTSLFQEERLKKQVDETAAVIRAAVKEESEAKLTSFDKSVAGEYTPGRGGPGFGGFGGPGPGGPGGGPGFDVAVVGGAAGGPGGPGGPGGGRGGPGGMPIKAFVGPRAKSVASQLAGESKGSENGFGGPGGGRGGPIDLAGMLAPAFMKAMDEDKDGSISREEFQRAFSKWFDGWGGDKGPLTADQVRAGIVRDLPGQGGMMPGPPPRQ